MNKKNIIFSGPVISASGYGHHSRDIARWLLLKEKEYGFNLYFDITRWGETQFYLKPEMEDGLVGEVLKRSGVKNQKYDVAFQLKLPNEFNPEMATTNIGITAGVETTVCNPKWIESINKMSLIITPSEFTKQTFINTGNVKTPIIVIPESFPDELLKEPNFDLLRDLNLKTKFNFLVFGQITGNNPENDRKNLFYTIRWLCEEFQDDSDVGVIIKTNSSRSTKMDKLATRNLMNKLAMEVKRSPNPKLYLLHGDLSKEELNTLYKHPDMKALVSFHRGEGFGLSLLEAATSGLPVISTDWSAPKEFLGNNFVKVNYQLSPIHESRLDGEIFFSQMQQWANPTEQDAKRQLREFKNNLQKASKDFTVSLKGRVVSKYNKKSIDLHYTDVLEHYIK